MNLQSAPRANFVLKNLGSGRSPSRLSINWPVESDSIPKRIPEVFGYELRSVIKIPLTAGAFVGLWSSLAYVPGPGHRIILFREGKDKPVAPGCTGEYELASTNYKIDVLGTSYPVHTTHFLHLVSYEEGSETAKVVNLVIQPEAFVCK